MSKMEKNQLRHDVGKREGCVSVFTTEKGLGFCRQAWILPAAGGGVVFVGVVEEAVVISFPTLHSLLFL